jgi:hypothetical protein
VCDSFAGGNCFRTFQFAKGDNQATYDGGEGQVYMSYIFHNACTYTCAHTNGATFVQALHLHLHSLRLLFGFLHQNPRIRLCGGVQVALASPLLSLLPQSNLTLGGGLARGGGVGGAAGFCAEQ